MFRPNRKYCEPKAQVGTMRATAEILLASESTHSVLERQPICVEHPAGRVEHPGAERLPAIHLADGGGPQQLSR